MTVEDPAVPAAPGAIVPVRTGVALPKLYAPDPGVAKRTLEFFTANIGNRNTRTAYARAAADFAAWCSRHGIEALGDAQPVHVAAYVEELQGRLAALR
jgi:hypothetical protein